RRAVRAPCRCPSDRSLGVRLAVPARRTGARARPSSRPRLREAAPVSNRRPPRAWARPVSPLVRSPDPGDRRLADLGPADLGPADPDLAGLDPADPDLAGPASVVLLPSASPLRRACAPGRARGSTWRCRGPGAP